MFLMSARRDYVKEYVLPQIVEKAQVMRDLLNQILTPLLVQWQTATPDFRLVSPLDGSFKVDQASLYEGQADEAPQNKDTAFHKPEWQQLWDQEIYVIFVTALRLRTKMASQGGNYEFTWPLLAKPIVTPGLVTLLPMLPVLEGQCQSMYAGPMSELRVVFPGKVFSTDAGN